MRVVSFLLVSELVERVDRLAVVELAVIHIFGRAHDGDVELAMTGTDMIPVDEVDVRKLAAIEDAVLSTNLQPLSNQSQVCYRHA